MIPTQVTDNIPDSMLEISVQTTLELIRLKLLCLIDVRQKFELEL